MVRHPRVVRPISLKSFVRRLAVHVSLWSLASRGIDRPGKRLLVFLRSIWLGIIPLTLSTDLTRGSTAVCDAMLTAHISTRVDQEPEVELGLVWQLGALALLPACCAGTR